MANSTSKLNPAWVRDALTYFKEFLATTGFPDPVRHGRRGSYFSYPEWLIMFIAVRSAKCQTDRYLAIHRLAGQYWDLMTKGLDLKPISESQRRDRLKKIRHRPGEPAGFIFQIVPPESLA